MGQKNQKYSIGVCKSSGKQTWNLYIFFFFEGGREGLFYILLLYFSFLH